MAGGSEIHPVDTPCERCVEIDDCDGGPFCRCPCHSGALMSNLLDSRLFVVMHKGHGHIAFFSKRLIANGELIRSVDCVHKNGVQVIDGEKMKCDTCGQDIDGTCLEY